MADWTQLSFIIAVALMIIVMGTALVVLWLILRGRIDLSQVLTEPDSTKASLSRFQFLLFTFVIAGLFLLLSIESGTFVTIPDSVLALLGISAGSYAVSKGINAGAKNAANRPVDPNASANASANAASASAAAAAAHEAAVHAANARVAAASVKSS